MFSGATAFNVSNIANCLLGDVPEDWTTSQEVTHALPACLPVWLPYLTANSDWSIQAAVICRMLGH